MTNPKGDATGALYGFIRSIQKLIKEVDPSHIVCVFDGPDNKKSRQKIFADYKGHRKDAPEDILPQFEWAYQFCDLAGIPKLCIEGVEADDVMGTIALWAEKNEATTFICTSDKDMAQLVNEHIFLMHPHKDYMVVDKKKVKELFGVNPNQIIDYLSITGDTSDNIPGIPGFGPKTACTLLNEFGTLENILQNIDKIPGAKKQQTFRDNQELARISQQLARLDTQIEIPDTLSFYEKKEPKIDDLSEFYHEMNFKSLQKELNSEGQNITENPRGKINAHLVDTDEKLEALLKHLEACKEICIDTETTGLDFMKAEVVGIGFGCSPGEAWYVPFSERVKNRLQDFFKKTKAAFFGHNIKYDIHILENEGIFLRNISFDTMLASYVLEPEKRRHNLDDLSLEKFKHEKISIESLIGKGKNQISMKEAPQQRVAEYCAEDIDCTVRLKELFGLSLKKRKLEDIFYKIELPLLLILQKMERQGVLIDTGHLKEIGKTLLSELTKLKQQIFSTVGKEFNLNSPKQLSTVLFTDLGLKKPPKAKTAFATGAEVLEDLAAESEVASHILKYRALEKLRSTYVEALPDSVNETTGKIHCSFNQSVAATGRLSSQDPNLQNIPTRSKEGKEIRSCFKPEKKGWSFIGGDYSQIELRLLAHLSGDEELIGAFKKGEDIHAFTASLIFNLPISMITPEMRHAAKTVNFGIIYGQGPYGLSKLLQISHKEASEFIKTYFERYPSIQKYLESSKEEARIKGYSTTLMGRQRPIPEINNKNPAIRAAAERLAVNTPLQGTAADLIKLAMIEIDHEIQNFEGRMILQIHDELIFEVPDSDVPEFKKLIQSKMENIFKLKVPIVVDIAVGKNWAEC